MTSIIIPSPYHSNLNKPALKVYRVITLLFPLILGPLKQLLSKLAEQFGDRVKIATLVYERVDKVSQPT